MAYFNNNVGITGYPLEGGNKNLHFSHTAYHSSKETPAELNNFICKSVFTTYGKEITKKEKKRGTPYRKLVIVNSYSFLIR